MYVVIYGRPGCPYCVRAAQLAEQLAEKRDDFEFNYIDMYAEGLSKADVAAKIGKPVETVPQVLVDNQHVGGCTDFEQYVREHALLG